ncbi:hypothetical protein KC19_N020700 [Ceratodon purpureus]|nr:hypothetical protein KC19_N020700 [Ceratodon purpureus]
MVRALGLLLPRPPRLSSLSRTRSSPLLASLHHSTTASLAPAPAAARLVESPLGRRLGLRFVSVGTPGLGLRRRSVMTKAVAMGSLSEVGLTKTAAAVVPEVEVKAVEVEIGKWTGDLLVVGVFEGSAGKGEGGKFENAELAALDERLVGLGKVEKATATTKVWKTLGGSLGAEAKKAQAGSAAVVVVDAGSLSEDVKHAAVTTITAGAVLGSFEDMRFKSEFKKPLLKSLELLGLGSGEKFDGLISQAVKQSTGVILAKQLVNAPPNVLIPSVMTSEAEAIAAAHGDVMTCQILEKEECEKLGMGAYLGVSAASTNPPKFIHMRYSPAGAVTTKLAIVGKGLTFDSGGYNLKTGPGCMIELMKFDMISQP